MISLKARGGKTCNLTDEGDGNFEAHDRVPVQHFDEWEEDALEVLDLPQHRVPAHQQGHQPTPTHAEDIWFIKNIFGSLGHKIVKVNNIVLCK